MMLQLVTGLLVICMLCLLSSIVQVLRGIELQLAKIAEKRVWNVSQSHTLHTQPEGFFTYSTRAVEKTEPKKM